MSGGRARKNEEGLGREDARTPLLPLSRLDSLTFSLAAVFVRYHQLRAWTGLHEVGGDAPFPLLAAHYLFFSFDFPLAPLNVSQTS